jgi:hypothetical protein
MRATGHISAVRPIRAVIGFESDMWGSDMAQLCKFVLGEEFGAT